MLVVARWRLCRCMFRLSFSGNTTNNEVLWFRFSRVDLAPKRVAIGGGSVQNDLLEQTVFFWQADALEVEREALRFHAQAVRLAGQRTDP